MRCTTLLLALCMLPIAAPAQFVAPNAVDSAALDAVRGGFGYGDNLLVTLGIERLVQVNGNVVDLSSVQFGDVGKLASGQAQLSGDALGTRLIQNGQPARLAAGLAAGALGGTIIQNSLNDQMINNQTTIRASVNSAGVLQTMNFNASLSQALHNAISSK
jgi:hypothetical protein